MNARLLRAAGGLVWLAASPAAAHDRSTSYSTWRVEADRVHVRVRLSSIDSTRLPEGDLGLRIASSFGASVDGVSCVREGDPGLSPGPEPGQIEAVFSLRCPPGERLVVRGELLAREAPSHVHLARIEGERLAGSEHVLVEGARQASVSLSRGEAAGVGRLVALGAEHVLSGADHLVFLAALLLCGGPWRSVLLVITGFTLGHSAALSLCALGLVRVDETAVEALIGLSVALISAENIWLTGGRALRWLPHVAALSLALLAAASLARGASSALALLGAALFVGCYLALLGRSARPLRPRAAVAAGFGLIHGLAFAGGLVALDIPPGRLLRALVGFNVGVELGQLAAVAALALPLALLARQPEARRARAVMWGSAATLALGVGWLVERSLAAR